jgi:molybdenum cofactor guanylyltransferase
MAEQRDIAAYILAGGKSSRMGRNKAMLEFGGAPLVARIAELAARVTGAQPTIVGRSDEYASLNLRVLPDDSPGIGPLGGIATALGDSRVKWNLILGCDLPFLTGDWLEYLIRRAICSHADAIVPYGDAGAEPLCAVYHKRCSANVAATIARGIRKVTDALAELNVERVDPVEWKQFDSDGLLFKNLNSPKDVEEISAVLERKYGRAART